MSSPYATIINFPSYTICSLRHLNITQLNDYILSQMPLMLDSNYYKLIEIYLTSEFEIQSYFN